MITHFHNIYMSHFDPVGNCGLEAYGEMEGDEDYITDCTEYGEIFELMYNDDKFKLAELEGLIEELDNDDLPNYSERVKILKDFIKDQSPWLQRGIGESKDYEKIASKIATQYDKILSTHCNKTSKKGKKKCLPKKRIEELLKELDRLGRAF